MSATSSTTSNMEDRSKAINQGSLLDDYQDNDEMGHTTDLLHAIRCWNLDRPMGTGVHDDDDDDDNDKRFSSMLVEPDDDNLDPTTTAIESRQHPFLPSTAHEHSTEPSSSTTIMTMSTPIISSTVKQQQQKHRGNYSAKASSLTARLLEEEFVPSIVLDQSSVVIHHPPITDVDSVGEDDAFLCGDVGVADATSSTMGGRLGNRASEGKGANPTQNKKDGAATTSIQNINFHKAKSKPHDKTKSNDPILILQESARLLGLPQNDWSNITTTIKRLVRVVEQHVPTLESFITEVCEEVETLESPGNDDVVLVAHGDNPSCQDDGSTTIVTTSTAASDNTTKQQVRHDKNARNIKRKKKKNERKERMAKALQTLKQEWPKHCSKERQPCRHSDSSQRKHENLHITIPTNTPRRVVLQEMDENSIKTPKMRHNRKGTSKPIIETQNADFYSLVMLMLNQREERLLDSTKDETKKTCQQAVVLTNSQAIQRVEDLLVIEERFNMIQGAKSYENQLTNISSQSSPKSPQNADGVISELFDTDTTTLRRFVLHFSYLFSVRQDEMVNKMQELYIFTNEARDFIHRIKEQMGLESSCSLHSVERVYREALEVKGVHTN